MRSSFGKVFMGAAGTPTGASDDEFNRVSFLSHFDGANNGVNNAFDDGSASNHTITANGNVTQGSLGPFARPDGEWAFNNTASTNDSFKVTAHDNFDMTNPFTIEGWIFLSDLTANKLLFGRENNYWMTHDYQGIGGASGKFGFNYQNSGSWGAINASAATVANTWYFLQATYVGTTVTFYINGVSQGTASVGSPASNTDKPFYVLSMSNVTHTGNASNVRLSSVARSTSLPTAKFTSDSDTELLVCQSNRFVDNGPDGHTITTTAGASVSAFGPFLTSSVYDAAVNGTSAYFSADGDYLSVANSSEFYMEDDAYTIEFWNFGGPAPGQTQYIFDNYKTGTSGGMTMYLSSAGKIHFRFSGNTGGYKDTATSNGAFIVSQWSHIAVVRTYVSSNTTVVIYVNGVAKATETFNGITAQSNTSEALTIGFPGQYAYRGYVSDFRMVKGTAVYTGNFTPPTAPLTAVTNTKLLLNMADGQAIDSAAQNNLTLVGNTDTSTGQAKFGNTSLFYDGSGDGAYYANGAALGTGDWTIETFLWVNDFNANLGVFQYGGANGALGSMVLTNQKIRVLSTGVAARLDTSGTINAQTWYHVAYVSYGGTLKVYINGTADSTTFDASSTTWTFTDTNIYVGARYYTSAVRNPFDGYLDEFRVSHFARYTSNFTAPSEPFADKGQ